MFRRKQPELTRRDFHFLCERHDFLVEQIKDLRRLNEAQDAAHKEQLAAVSEQLTLVKNRCDALDSWFQSIAGQVGMAPPALDRETSYEGFEDVENAGYDPEDFSLEYSLAMVGEVPMPQTENSEPVETDDLQAVHE